MGLIARFRQLFRTVIGLLLGRWLEMSGFVMKILKMPINGAFGTARYAKSTIFATVTLGAILLVFMWLSIFLYATFYYTYVPTLTHKRDVNLQFSTDCDRNSQNCKFPSSNMTLVAPGQTQRGSEELLARGQAYAVSLQLEMPESEVNQDSGMMMVVLQLKSYEGDVVHQASRAVSTILRYKNRLQQLMETVFYFPLYILGYKEQKQEIHVELIASFIDDPFHPIQSAYVEIQSPSVHIYQSSLIIEARLSGLRYIMYQFPLTSALTGISTLTIFFCVVALLSWYSMFSHESSDSPSELLHLNPTNTVAANLQSAGKDDKSSSSTSPGPPPHHAETLASSSTAEWQDIDTKELSEGVSSTDIRQRHK